MSDVTDVERVRERVEYLRRSAQLHCRKAPKEHLDLWLAEATALTRAADALEREERARAAEPLPIDRGESWVQVRTAIETDPDPRVAAKRLALRLIRTALDLEAP